MKAISVVKEVLSSLTHGELQTAGGLTLLPLFGGRAVPDYVLAEQAGQTFPRLVAEIGPVRGMRRSGRLRRSGQDPRWRPA